jgi:RNA polymerase sigma-70 factor (ECF subfamily)
VLTLRFVDDLSLAEIALALDVPLGTVKSRLHLALKELREDSGIKDLFEP